MVVPPVVQPVDHVEQVHDRGLGGVGAGRVVGGRDRVVETVRAVGLAVLVAEFRIAGVERVRDDAGGRVVDAVQAGLDVVADRDGRAVRQPRIAGADRAGFDRDQRRVGADARQLGKRVLGRERRVAVAQRRIHRRDAGVLVGEHAVAVGRVGYQVVAVQNRPGLGRDHVCPGDQLAIGARHRKQFHVPGRFQAVGARVVDGAYARVTFEGVRSAQHRGRVVPVIAARLAQLQRVGIQHPSQVGPGGGDGLVCAAIEAGQCLSGLVGAVGEIAGNGHRAEIAVDQHVQLAMVNLKPVDALPEADDGRTVAVEAGITDLCRVDAGRVQAQRLGFAAQVGAGHGDQPVALGGERAHGRGIDVGAGPEEGRASEAGVVLGVQVPALVGRRRRQRALRGLDQKLVEIRQAAQQLGRRLQAVATGRRRADGLGRRIHAGGRSDGGQCQASAVVGRRRGRERADDGGQRAGGRVVQRDILFRFAAVAGALFESVAGNRQDQIGIGVEPAGCRLASLPLDVKGGSNGQLVVGALRHGQHDVVHVVGAGWRAGIRAAVVAGQGRPGPLDDNLLAGRGRHRQFV